MKSQRKFPKAKPEPNNGQKMVMIVKTRSPMEAYQMLRQGMPIDQALGYYLKQGLVDKDVWLMDNVEKLHLLQRVREMKAGHQEDIEELTRQAEEERKQREVTNQNQ